MSTQLTPIKSFLGKYYTELLYSSTQDKYKDTGLELLFDQRFLIQNNKVQMVIDASITGLVMNVSGNEIYISKELYDHPNVTVSNSLETGQDLNPKNLYNPAVFSTVAYLVCQNHTTLHISGDIDEPIYVKYKADYETFYNSIVVFNIDDNINVEIVEEIESFSALNSVTNYILGSSSTVNLSTFYKSHLTAVSFCHRNIMMASNASFNHVLLGKGSAIVIDENRIQPFLPGAKIEMLGVVNSVGKNFHSILSVEPATIDFTISVKYKDILRGNAKVIFHPTIVGHTPGAESATIEVSGIALDEISDDNHKTEINNYISDIIDRTILERMTGVKRFYNNKTEFLRFL